MIHAYILGILRTNNENNILEQLNSVEGVDEAHMVYGKYDIVARINANDMNELKEIVFNKVRAIDGIEKTKTLISLVQ